MVLARLVGGQHTVASLTGCNKPTLRRTCFSPVSTPGFAPVNPGNSEGQRAEPSASAPPVAGVEPSPPPLPPSAGPLPPSVTTAVQARGLVVP